MPDVATAALELPEDVPSGDTVATPGAVAAVSPGSPESECGAGSEDTDLQNIPLTGT